MTEDIIIPAIHDMHINSLRYGYIHQGDFVIDAGGYAVRIADYLTMLEYYPENLRNELAAVAKTADSKDYVFMLDSEDRNNRHALAAYAADNHKCSVTGIKHDWHHKYTIPLYAYNNALDIDVVYGIVTNSDYLYIVGRKGDWLEWTIKVARFDGEVFEDITSNLEGRRLRRDYTNIMRDFHAMHEGRLVVMCYDENSKMRAYVFDDANKTWSLFGDYEEDGYVTKLFTAGGKAYCWGNPKDDYLGDDAPSSNIYEGGDSWNLRVTLSGFQEALNEHFGVLQIDGVDAIGLDGNPIPLFPETGLWPTGLVEHDGNLHLTGAFRFKKNEWGTFDYRQINYVQCGATPNWKAALLNPVRFDTLNRGSYMRTPGGTYYLYIDENEDWYFCGSIGRAYYDVDTPPWTSESFECTGPVRWDGSRLHNNTGFGQPASITSAGSMMRFKDNLVCGWGGGVYWKSPNSDHWNRLGYTSLSLSGSVPGDSRLAIFQEKLFHQDLKYFE